MFQAAVMKNQSIVYCSTIEAATACYIHSSCIYSNNVENTLAQSKFERQKWRVRKNKRPGRWREEKRLTKAGEVKQEVKTSEKGGEAEDGWQGKGSWMGEKDKNFYMYVLNNLWHVLFNSDVLSTCTKKQTYVMQNWVWCTEHLKMPVNIFFCYKCTKCKILTQEKKKRWGRDRFNWKALIWSASVFFETFLYQDTKSFS